MASDIVTYGKLSSKLKNFYELFLSSIYLAYFYQEKLSFGCLVKLNMYSSDNPIQIEAVTIRYV